MPVVPQSERLDALKQLGLSPALLALASERWPHRSFEFPCDHVYRCYDVPDEFWPEPFIPLWECTETVVGCRPTETGILFLDWYLESLDPPEPLARTEQGLFFWLFSYLIEYEDWDDEAAALRRLREAATTVGFRHFDPLWEFADEFGKETDYRDRGRNVPWNIPT